MIFEYLTKVLYWKVLCSTLVIILPDSIHFLYTIYIFIFTIYIYIYIYLLVHNYFVCKFFLGYYFIAVDMIVFEY